MASCSAYTSACGNLCCFISVMMLTSFSERGTPVCFAFHQRKAPFCLLQETTHNTLEIPTLQLEKGVDSSAGSSHRLLTYCLAKFWVAPTTCLQNHSWVQFGARLFQDLSQKPPWQSLPQAWVPYTPPVPAHQSLHPHGHLTGHKTLVLSVML